MNKFMNKNILAVVCLVSMIALLPACGGDKCSGGSCPVKPAEQVEETKAVDAQNASVETTAEVASVEAAPAETTVEEVK